MTLHELLKKLVAKTHWVNFEDQEENHETLMEIDRRLKLFDKWEVDIKAKETVLSNIRKALGVD